MPIRFGVLLAGGVLIAQGDGIERVAWLRGCWEAKSARRTVEEQWMAPRGHSMVNMGRTVRGDSLVEFEQVVLREQGDRLAYQSHPAGQPSATFLSSLVSDSAVIFENPQHDFPQRVGYNKRGADSLIAWIDGSIGGRTRRVEFPYARVRCAGE